ncbi:hypothetical protein BASA50_004101 [Batrachochytrium salamandrivorans]|uniref:Uncharacterized protein n=1 Tax=Batrachochytrium salamandrivorans TaxID=1357716 RepID=A0ABQ8FGI9_9FUNG|nr:hypothetical protein BASA50_004101 [Batrachochytrium salamandrivorans]
MTRRLNTRSNATTNRPQIIPIHHVSHSTTTSPNIDSSLMLILSHPERWNVGLKTDFRQSLDQMSPTKVIAKADETLTKLQSMIGSAHSPHSDISSSHPSNAHDVYLDAMGLTLLVMVIPPHALKCSPTRSTAQVSIRATGTLNFCSVVALDRLVLWLRWLDQQLEMGGISKVTAAAAAGEHLFSLLNRICLSNAEHSITATRGILGILNLLLTQCTSNKQKYSVDPDICHTTSLVALLRHMPDVQLQLEALEFIYRLLPRLKSERARFLSKIGIGFDKNIVSFNSTNFWENSRRYLQVLNSENDGMHGIPLTILLDKAKSVLLDNGSSWAPKGSVWLDIGRLHLNLIVANDADGEVPEVDMELLFTQIRSFSTVVSESEICMVVDSAVTRQIVTLYTKEVKKVSRILDYHKVPQSSKSSVVMMPVMVQVPQIQPKSPASIFRDHISSPIDGTFEEIENELKENISPLEILSDMETVVEKETEADSKPTPVPLPSLPPVPFRELSLEYMAKTPTPVVQVGRAPIIDAQHDSLSGSVYSGGRACVAPKAKRRIVAVTKPVKRRPPKRKRASHDAHPRNHNRTPKTIDPIPEEIAPTPSKKSALLLDSAPVSVEIQTEHYDSHLLLDNAAELIARRTHLLAQLQAASHLADLNPRIESSICSPITHQSKSTPIVYCPAEDVRMKSLLPHDRPIDTVSYQRTQKRQRQYCDAKQDMYTATLVSPQPVATLVKVSGMHVTSESPIPVQNRPALTSAPVHWTIATHDKESPLNINSAISELLDQISQAYSAFMTETLEQVGNRLNSATADTSYVVLVQRAVERRIERTHEFAGRIHALRQACRSPLP